MNPQEHGISPLRQKDFEQRLLTIDLENKRQWYGRNPEPPLVPPTWLGFPNPLPEPEDPPCCRDYSCVNVFVPDIAGIYSSATLHGGWYRLESASSETCVYEYHANGSPPYSPNTIKSISLFKSTFYSSPETEEWVLVVVWFGDDGVSPGGDVVWRFGPTLDCGAVNTKDGGHVVHCVCPVDLTRPKAGVASVEFIADCSVPPPTNTGTGTGTGSPSGGGGSPCGDESPMFVFSATPSPGGWYPLTYPCVSPCYAVPPEGTSFDGDVQPGSCVQP